MKKNRKLISIITPTWNEEENITECYQAIKKIFNSALSDYDYEHIFCDNNSSDATIAKLKNFANEDKNVRAILNSSNFGVIASTWNALMNARGDAAVVLFAADLQDPAEVIIKFVEKWSEGHKIVYGIRKNRNENFIKSSFRSIYYFIINKFSNFHIPSNVGTFQLVDRKVLDSFKEVDDYQPNIRGLIARCGFNAVGIEYDWQERKHGESKESFYSLTQQALNDTISFSNVPLRIAMFAGFFIATLSIIYSLISLILVLVNNSGDYTPGIPTLIVAIFFFSGVQLFFLGVLGEYVSAIHSQVRKKPIVVERERINFD